MAIYRTIQINFWTDRKVIDEFTPEDRYFFLYLFTNPHTNLAGCYEFSVKQAAVELGYDATAVLSLLKRFDEVHQVIRYSELTKEVLLINWFKYNWTDSKKFRTGLISQIEEVKDSSFREYLLALYNYEDTVSIPYGYRMDTSVTDIHNPTTNNTVINTVNPTKKNKPKKDKGNLNTNPELRPTIDDINAYIAEKGYNVDGHKFLDYFEASGWIDGQGNPVRNWKQKLITWSKNNYDNDFGRSYPQCRGIRTDYGECEDAMGDSGSEWAGFVAAPTI